MRAALLASLGRADDPGATAEARRLVDRELAAPKSVEATLLNVAVGVAASTGDAALYDKYLARSKAAVDPEDRYRFLYALTSFDDPALVKRTMDHALGPDVRSQDTKLVIASMLGNGPARNQVWDLLRERWPDVQKKTGEFVGNTVIVGALASFCDPGHADEIKAFFESHPVPDAARTLQQSLERINSCSALAAAQSAKLAAWLNGNRQSIVGNRQPVVTRSPAIACRPAADHRPTTDYRPPTTDHRPPTIDYRPSTTDFVIADLE
jgi:aminopeptidase N